MFWRFMSLVILLGIYTTRAAKKQNVFKLDNSNPNDPNLKSLVIKGIAKFKPGGSAMILSLLIQGAPGMMPGGTPACCSKAPTANPMPPTQPPSPSVAPSPLPPPATPPPPVPQPSTGGPTVNTGAPTVVPPKSTGQVSPVPQSTMPPSPIPRTMPPSPMPRRTIRPSAAPRTMQPSPFPRRTMRTSAAPRTMRPSPFPRRTIRLSAAPRTMRPSPFPRRTIRPSAAPRTMRPSPFPRTSIRPSQFPRSPRPMQPTRFPRRFTRPPMRSSTGPTEGPPPTEPNNGPPTGSTGGPPMGANAQPPTTPNGISTGTALPSVPPTPQQPAKDFEQEALEVHNNFRQKHNSPKMRLNKQMSQMAQAYAQKIAQLGVLKHSPASERQGQGENLSMGCRTGPNGGQTVTEAVNNWYNEVCSPGYEFGTEKMGGAGHFTQVIWRGSTELGIGKADGMKGNLKCTYIVGRYNPAGNFIGRFKNNAQTGTFNRDAYCSKNRLRDYQEPQPMPKIMAISETVKRNRLKQRKVNRNQSSKPATR